MEYLHWDIRNSDINNKTDTKFNIFCIILNQIQRKGIRLNKEITGFGVQ